MADNCRVYYTNENEYFIREENTSKRYPFAESLLDFLYLDFTQQDALLHIYFTMLGADQFSDAKKKRLLTEAAALQQRLETLFSEVLDVLPAEKSMRDKLAEYSTACDDAVRLSFSVLSTGYEHVERGVFTETLYPNSLEELVEFFVRECVRRELRFRRCKSCGKFFALTGYANTEYCDRLFGDSGKTCKEAGAVRIYRTKVTADPVVRAFNKAYKKRFAWIKYKKITKEAFYEWSERARTERDKCLAIRKAADDDDDIKLRALEELEKWLAEN